MRKLLGPLAAVVTASLLLVLGGGEALANHVQCGDVITQDTTLDSDLDCPGDGLVIGADNVTLDLGGHTIRGPGSGYGVVTARAASGVPKRDIEVRDGVIENFESAVAMDIVDGAVVRDLTLRGGGVECDFVSSCTVAHNTIVGPLLRYFAWAISLGKSDGDIRDNTIVGGSIFLGKASATITGNLVEGAPDTGIDLNHGHATVMDNVVRMSGRFGFTVSSGSADVTGNTLTENLGSGACICDRGSATMTDNTITRNREHGIVLPNYSGATITGNVISQNVLDGVHAVAEYDHALPNPRLYDNRIDRNGADGIRTNSPIANLSGNHTWFNGNLGIEAVPGVSGGGNWAKHNGNPAQCVPSYLCSTTGKPKK